MPSSIPPYKNKITKIGQGSLGGKASGLKFITKLLEQNPKLHQKFNQVELIIPQTLIITTDGFDDFLSLNGLQPSIFQNIPDEKIAQIFLQATIPEWITSQLFFYLKNINDPLAVRSSSLLEDARYRSYAGLYHTYMLANNHSDIEKRMEHLIQAIKLVYASTYFHAPKSFRMRVGHNGVEEKMAVIIQQTVGKIYDKHFYPAISGVAQSNNYYPFGHMKPEEGIATIAMGLGKIVVEGEQALRFSPKYPEILPQRSTVKDILRGAQRFFYSIKMDQPYRPLNINDNYPLIRREVADIQNHSPLRHIASTYIPEEDRIRDTTQCDGYRVLTFAQILKHNHFPLADIISESLKLGQDAMGHSVEIEFAVNLNSNASSEKSQFAFLQMRPMSARIGQEDVRISGHEHRKAFCRSNHALGNAFKQDMRDILLVHPNTFDISKTINIAKEISNLNLKLIKQGRKYLLIGPGRWGSNDRWLGIPVAWQDIYGVGAIVETYSPQMPSEPSQGSHFFHNISTIGINYLTIGNTDKDYLNWDWLLSQPSMNQGPFVIHLRFDNPMILKVDGRKLNGVIYF
ncbi:MAG: PEP/pyruvate-binding domain-containing protein [Desulfobacteraceae bacterium]